MISGIMLAAVVVKAPHMGVNEFTEAGEDLGVIPQLTTKVAVWLGRT